MLKLLIVEDEKWEREGLLDFLDWKSFGITTIETACDGIEGYNKAKRMQPEIIITDIKMPGMDGIVMSKKIKEFLPAVKIIILSGYDDFRLAKEAISFNANAYVLKPLDEEELMPIIQKVVEECKKKIEKAEKESLINTMLTESQLKSKTKFINDLLEGKIECNEIQKLINDYDIRTTPEMNYLVLVIKFLDDSNIDKINSYPANINSVLNDILDVLESILGSSMIFSLSDSFEKLIKCCISIPKADTALCPSILINILPIINQKIELNTYLGIGKAVESLDAINLSNTQALLAVEYGIFWSVTDIIEYASLEKKQRSFIDTTGDFLVKNSYFSKQMIHAVRSSNEDRLFELLTDMFQHLNDSYGAGKDLIVNYLQNILNETTILLYTLNMDFDLSSFDKNDLGFELNSHISLKTIEEFIFNFFKNTLKSLSENKNNKDIQIIKKVTTLIEEKYMLDINLKIIAGEVFLSPNYLGSIFKKCTGKTFNDYLCEFRMEKAKELLKFPKNKVNLVATKVGIPNTSYFCTIFKDTFGMAPGEYQETILRNM